MTAGNGHDRSGSHPGATPPRSKADVARGDRKPTSLPVRADDVPTALQDRPQWVAWRYVRKGKWTKVPIDPHTGRAASSTDPATWGTFREALDYHLAHPDTTDGIGFVFAEGGPFAGVDLDDSLTPDGTLKPWAEPLVTDLASYTEVSPSGAGVKVIVRGAWSSVAGGAKPRNKKRYADGEVEGYDRGRFFTVTGQRLPDTPGEIADAQDPLKRLYAAVFTADRGRGTATEQGGVSGVSGGSGLTADRGRGTATEAGATNGRAEAGGRGRASGFRARPGSPHDLTDDELLERVGRSKQGEKFRRLWSGDTSQYPSPSEADAALLGMLAFWTGPDRERLDRLFQRSGLFRKDKWGARPDYRQRTLDLVLEGKTEFYTPAARCGGRTSANGHGRNGEVPPGAPGGVPPATSSPPTGNDGPPATGYDMILGDFRQKYAPTFRRGAMLFSSALGRGVNRSEACFAGGIELMAQLARASDAPRNRDDLPRFFRNWAPVAWRDILDTLPDEQEGAEIDATAGEEFRGRVRDAFFSHVTIGERLDRSEVTETQRRSLIGWCRLWAKPGPWRPVRDYLCWIRKAAGGPAGGLRVAVRAELFGQAGRGSELAKLGQNSFTRLAERYGVGVAQKACGSRCVELDPEFLASLLAGPMDEWTDETGATARAREGAGKKSTEGGSAL